MNWRPGRTKPATSGIIIQTRAPPSASNASAPSSWRRTATWRRSNRWLPPCKSWKFLVAAERRATLIPTVVEANVPDDLEIHIVMDNLATHKTKTTRDWFARHPRWHVHFTPTSASWLNQVERFFALLTEKQLRRAVHRSTRELEADILDYIDVVNDNPKPFRWTKSADDILATIQRFCLRTLDLSKAQQIKQTSESGH